MADLKKEIREIAEVAKGCPDEFRLKCFEILLNDVLGRAGQSESTGATSGRETTPGSSRAFQDFCRKHSVPEEAAKNVFDFTNPQSSIQVSDFRQNTKSKQQIVIGLLAAIGGLQERGVATVDDDAFRKLCETHHVYDKANFARHMKSYKKYFIGADDEWWKLTAVGLKKAAEVIKSLGGDFKL
jgi:hypothetical protein